MFVVCGRYNAVSTVCMCVCMYGYMCAQLAGEGGSGKAGMHACPNHTGVVSVSVYGQDDSTTRCTRHAATERQT